MLDKGLEHRAAFWRYDGIPLSGPDGILPCLARLRLVHALKGIAASVHASSDAKGKKNNAKPLVAQDRYDW
jgi:hypothetical protein